MDADIDDYQTESYNYNDEPRPDSVIYTEIFSDLKTCTREAANLLRQPLANSTFQSPITAGLQKEVAKRTKEDFPDQATFAVIGDMKAGKSSVINSILSVGTIARKGDGGDSCTWVVQRYMKSFPGQNATFAAKVFFFGRDEIRDILSSLLAKYFRAANQDEKPEDENEEDEGYSSNVETFGDMRDTMTAFMALFCEHDEFETEASARAFLKQAKSENDEFIVDTLLEWADEVVQSKLDGMEAVVFECSTPAELLWRLQPYTFQVDGIDGEGVVAPWPLVSVIDFGLDHPLLQEGIVLVDSPGLSDANAARSRNAIIHHRECTHKMIVAEIGRAEADKNLRKALEDAYRTRGSGKTILVLTHGDDIDSETEVTGTPLEKNLLAKHEKDLKALRDQKRAKTAQRQKARFEERDDFDEELRSISKQINVLNQKRDDQRLKMRNRKVVTNLQDIYKRLTQDPKPLAVFAVGNKVYQQYQAGFTEDCKPSLSVEQTNVPALREQLYKMPIDGRFNDTMHLAEVQLPNLVNFFELYCLELHMARKADVEAIILEPKSRLRGVVHEVFDALKQTVCETILSPMRNQEEAWTQEARKLCREWAKKYNGTLTNFKKKGVHKPRRRGAVGINWTEELQMINKEPLEQLFSEFRQKSMAWPDTLAAGVARLCDSPRDIIKRDEALHALPLAPFLKRFNGEKKNITQKSKSISRRLAKDVSVIIEKTIMFSDDCFFSLAMKAIYEEVCQTKGAGAPKKRADQFERLVTKSNGVWTAVHDSIENAFDQIFKQCEDHVVGAFGEIFDDLHQAFLTLCDSTETKDEKDKIQEGILRAELREKLIEAKARVEAGGRITELVAKCKAYTNSANASPIFVSQ